jgi:hypothetical protein
MVWALLITLQNNNCYTMTNHLEDNFEVVPAPRDCADVLAWGLRDPTYSYNILHPLMTGEQNKRTQVRCHDGWTVILARGASASPQQVRNKLIVRT